VQRPVSSGAARRAARSKQRSSSSRGWIAVGVVVVVVVALIVFKLTSSSGTPASSGDAAGRNPALAPASIVYPVTHVSDSVFNSVGTDGESTTIFSTTGQSALTSGGLVRFVYFGAEYCPYCAAMRWSVVAALSRFGTFSGLKDTSSGNDDGDIPTFSFLGSTFTSKYLVFTPYEYEDRNQKPLQPVPNDVESLVTKYDFPPYTTTDAEGGIPFLDVGNKYIQAGDSQDLAALVVNGVLANGGPGRQAVANAIADPTSTIGTAISAKYFISEANFISAAVCLEDGGMPGSVCTSPGVKGAETQLVALKPTK
jgi:thiol-disulfide isomerase/thioredoxin